MSFAKHPGGAPAAGSFFDDYTSQAIHLNRLPGGAGVRCS